MRATTVGAFGIVLATMLGVGACTTSPAPGNSATTASSATATGSGSAAAAALPADARIEYRYGDASVPPEYHRSETLTVDAQNATLAIDSYGDVLAKERAQTTAQVWSQLEAGYPQVAAIVPPSGQPGCAGGTTREVTVTSGGTTLLDLSIDDCGGSGAAEAEQVDAWIRPARDLFPPTEKLAPTG